MKKTASFTLIEILIAMVILAVLASISLATFQKTVSENKERVCKQNLKVLEAAIDIYAVENDALPDTLAKLEPRYIHLAYQKILGNRSENRFIAYLKDALGLRPALAVPLPEKYYGYNKKALKCPADTSADAVSYGINSAVFDTADKLRNPTLANNALVYDNYAYHKKTFSSDTYQFGLAPSKIYGKQTRKDNDTLVPDSRIVIPEPQEHDDDDGDCPEGFTADYTSCCKATQAEWKQMPKECRHKCVKAKYKAPYKDGTPKGKYINAP